MIVTQDRYGMTEVNSDSTGNLTCVKCNSLWCDHIQNVIKSGGDWEVIREVYQRCPFVTVPVKPTDGVSAIVWLEKMDRPTWQAKVYLQSPLRADPERVCRGDDWFIGFIGQGEGRLVIRNLVIEAFTDKAQWDTVIHCESSFHDWNRRSDMAHLMREGKLMDRIVQAWNSQWFKRCKLCLDQDKQVSSSGWDPDLIPEAEPIRRRPPRSSPGPGRPRYKP